MVINSKAWSCVACDSGDLAFYPSEFTEFITSFVFQKTGRKKTRTVFCRQCESVFSERRFNKLETEKLYKNYRGRNYTRERLKFEPNYKFDIERYAHLVEVENLISHFVKKINYIVDIGSDTRTNTLFKNKAVLLQPFGTNLAHLSSFPTKTTLFQLSHVLEHVSDPRSLLYTLAQNLDWIYIEVPFEKHIEEKREPSLKVHWHEHINFFTEKGIRSLLRECDLDPVFIKPIDCDIGTSFTKVLSVLARSPSLEDMGPCDMNPLEGAY